MTILRLENPTNIYRIDAKKLGGERGYLAVEDLWIKSKFPRFNIPIREVERSGESKNPRGRRKKRKKAQAGRLGAGLKHHLDTIDLGTILSANNHDAKLGTNNNDAKIYGADTTREQTLERCPNLALASVFFAPGTKGPLVPVGITNQPGLNVPLLPVGATNRD